MVADDALCYRHRDRIAAVGCQRCDRPICPECMHPASVGFHCPECTRQGAQRVYRPGDLMSRPIVTYVLMGISILAFIEDTARPAGSLNRGLLWGPWVQAGESWRIITSAFLHSGALHIGFNMYLLYMLGTQLEPAVGRLRFGLIYLGGLLGAAAAVLSFDFGTPTVGASGAVLGLAGAIGVFLASRGQSITQTPLAGLIALNLLLPLFGAFRISFWGHAGGIAGGALVAAVLFLAPRMARGTPPWVWAAVAGVLVAALGAASVLSAELGGLTI